MLHEKSGLEELVRKPTDYMSIGYQLAQEPLKLCERGRSWFKAVYEFHAPALTQSTLVLGAVSWMAELLSTTSHEVYIVDSSMAMLNRIQIDQQLLRKCKFNLLHANWHNLRLKNANIGVTFGDNSFTYMEFPKGWAQLCHDIADETHAEGKIFIRLFSVPNGHKSENFEQIIERFAEDDVINYTEVRTRLLFSGWNPATYQIHPERILDLYESKKTLFETLLKKLPSGTANDLETISKYRNSNAVYSAPPLADVLEVFSERFVIESVHFGPYALAEYFPLIVAKKKIVDKGGAALQRP